MNLTKQSTCEGTFACGFCVIQEKRMKTKVIFTAVEPEPKPVTRQWRRLARIQPYMTLCLNWSHSGCRMSTLDSGALINSSASEAQTQLSTMGCRAPSSGSGTATRLMPWQVQRLNSTRMLQCCSRHRPIGTTERIRVSFVQSFFFTIIQKIKK